MVFQQPPQSVAMLLVMLHSCVLHCMLLLLPSLFLKAPQDLCWLFFSPSKWYFAFGTLIVSSNNCDIHFLLYWEFYKILTALSVLSQMGGVSTALTYTVLRTC